MAAAKLYGFKENGRTRVAQLVAKYEGIDLEVRLCTEFLFWHRSNVFRLFSSLCTPTPLRARFLRGMRSSTPTER
jgi:hypothetical protein